MKQLVGIILIGLSTSLPGMGQTALEKSIRMYNQGRYQDASRLLLRIIKENPWNDTAYYYLGLVNLNDDYAKSIEYLGKAVRLRGVNAKYRVMLGNAYGMKAQKGSIFTKIGAAGKCLKEYEAAVRADPKYIDARRSLMEYYLQAPGIVGGSVAKAVAQCDTISILDEYAGFLARSRIYEYQNDRKAEEESYRKAIVADPKKTSAYRGLWWLYLKEKKVAKANALLAQAIRSVDDKSEIYYWAGLYSIQENDLSKAREMLDSALAADPGNAAVYYQMGKVSLLSGRNLRNGLKAFEKYLSIQAKSGNPGYAYAHWRMGMIYEKLGMTDSARAQYMTALELAPNITEAKKALKNLR